MKYNIELLDKVCKIHAVLPAGRYSHSFWSHFFFLFSQIIKNLWGSFVFGISIVIFTFKSDGGGGS